MALEVEDGTGKANAESYVAAAAYRAFWVARGDAVIGAVAPTDAELEADLREGFAWVNRRRNWKGIRLQSTQAGAFPRQVLYDAEGYLVAGVPAAVAEAQMRAARAHRTSPLFSRTERVGALIEKTVEDVVSQKFAEPTRVAGNDAFDLIDALLDEFATSSRGSVRLLRG